MTGYSLKGIIGFWLLVILLFSAIFSGEWGNAGQILLYLLGGMILYQVVRWIIATVTGYDPDTGHNAIHLKNNNQDFSQFTLPEGIILPSQVTGDLFLNKLVSTEGLKLPETIDGSLYLSSLTSAKGLKLPKTIGGELDLHNLVSAEGVVLPETIGGILRLNHLSSVKGLRLPKAVGGVVDIRGITLDEKNTLKKQYPELKIH